MDRFEMAEYDTELNESRAVVSKNFIYDSYSLRIR